MANRKKKKHTLLDTQFNNPLPSFSLCSSSNIDIWREERGLRDIFDGKHLSHNETHEYFISFFIIEKKKRPIAINKPAHPFFVHLSVSVGGMKRGPYRLQMSATDV